MEKVAILSGLVVCLVFVLGSISSYLDNRPEIRKSDRDSKPVESVVKVIIPGALMGGLTNPIGNAATSSKLSESNRGASSENNRGVSWNQTSSERQAPSVIGRLVHE